MPIDKKKIGNVSDTSYFYQTLSAMIFRLSFGDDVMYKPSRKSFNYNIFQLNSDI